jgi:hypothetical protein
MALNPCRFGKRRSDRFAIISQTTFATFGKFFSRRADQAADTRYSSARVSKAHSTRAFLFASATAAILGPRRSLSASIHTLRRARMLGEQRSAERAPWINRVRRYRSPRLLIPSSIVRSPLECSRGTNPSHALKSLLE